MTQSNPRKYALARQRVQDGRWVVDPDAGTVWSARTGQLLRPTIFRGYRRLYVYDPDLRKTYQVMLSRVVWESVHGPITDPELEVNHMDGDKSNNSIHNFELITQYENYDHSVRIGLRKDRRVRGGRLEWSHLTDDMVVEIHALLAQGITQRVIAERYRVHQKIISDIRRGVRWNHVPQAVDLRSVPIDRSRSRHNRAVLTAEQVLEIRQLLRQGVFQKVVAERYGVTQASISAIWRGKNWAHLPDTAV